MPPSINESYAKFTVEDGKIRFGLSAVKNVGENIIDSIVKSRLKYGKFKDLVDFCSNIEIQSINKRVVESLIKAGAFDCFGKYRSQLSMVYEKIIDSVINSRKKNIKGQLSLFSEIKDSSIEIQYPDVKEFLKRDMLSMEKEMTGLYLSGHPLDEYEKTLKLQTDTKISDIVIQETLEESFMEESRVRDGDKVIVGGILSEVSRKITKNNDMMAFARLEDLYGGIEAIIFSKNFQKFKSLIYDDSLILVKGRISIREEEQPKLICEIIESLIRIDTEKLYILIKEQQDIKDTLKEVKPLLIDFSGNIPVYLCTQKERRKFRLDRDFWVKSDPALMGILKKRFGDNNVKII